MFQIITSVPNVPNRTIEERIPQIHIIIYNEQVNRTVTVPDIKDMLW